MIDREPNGIETLLIGLDGACREILDPLFDEGRLPTLASLFERGVVGDLDSQIPPWTPSAWPSLYTGVNPGKHGAFDFLTFEGYDWELVNRTHVREHALWELLDSRGGSSVVVNVPVTGPPRTFDGALVPGYIGPDQPTCHPEGILDGLEEELGEYRIYAPDGVSGQEQIEWYRRLIEMRGEAFRLLTDRFDPTFGFLQFQQTDTVFHERPEDEEAVRAVYEAVDAELEQTLEACNPDTVIVASDHGMGPYDGYEFHVNEFLHERGYLKTTTGEGGMPSWTALARAKESDGPSLSERLVSLASSLGVTSQQLGAVLERLGLKDAVLRHVSTDTVRAGTRRVDFANSVAYVRAPTELGVRINKAGREPDGVVAPAEFTAVRDDIINDLREVETPAGEPVFSEVVPASEYFNGPHAEAGVDILTVPKEFDNLLSASMRGNQFDKLSGVWNHKRTGMVALAGDGVDESTSIDDAHLFDIAPTVLSTLDVCPSSRMDGSTLGPVEPVEPATYPPFNACPTSSKNESVTQRLSQLGYIHDNEH